MELRDFLWLYRINIFKRYRSFKLIALNINSSEQNYVDINIYFHSFLLWLIQYSSSCNKIRSWFYKIKK